MGDVITDVWDLTELHPSEKSNMEDVVGGPSFSLHTAKVKKKLDCNHHVDCIKTEHKICVFFL